jgi:hypothetical protein
MKIPIPSLEVQEDIIRKCDFLRELNKKLEINIVELKECYKIEYECFIKNNFNKEEKEIKTLGEVCNLKNGTNITKDKLITGKYPVIGGGQIPLGLHNDYNVIENTIIISKDGSYAGFISKYNSKAFITNHGIYIDKINDKILKDYIYYYLKSNQNELYKLQSGAGQPGIKKEQLEEIKIPIPSLEVQERFIKFCENKDSNQYNIHIKIIENTIENNKILMKKLFDF